MRDVLKDVLLPWYNAYRFFTQSVLRLQKVWGGVPSPGSVGLLGTELRGWGSEPWAGGASVQSLGGTLGLPPQKSCVGGSFIPRLAPPPHGTKAAGGGVGVKSPRLPGWEHLVKAAACCRAH